MTFTDITATSNSLDIPRYGTARRQAILALQEKIARRLLEENDCSLDGFDAEADRLVFRYAVHWKCFPIGRPEWHHLELSTIVRAGLDLSSRAPEEWAPRQALSSTLQQAVVSLSGFYTLLKRLLTFGVHKMQCLHLTIALGHDLPLLMRVVLLLHAATMTVAHT